MKRAILIALILISIGAARGQETLQSVTDRGYTTTNRLIVDRVTNLTSRITAYGYNNGYFDIYNNSNNSISLALKRSDGESVFEMDGHTMKTFFGGMLGIGNQSPQYKLDVNGDTRLLTTIVTASNSPFSTSSVFYSQPGYNNIFGVDGTWTSKYFGMKTNGTFIVMGGNMGIGTATPEEKLSVNGKIRSKEVKVEITNWPDYVFTKDYKLPTLAETEIHIKEKGYLPGIPSAAEVKENGVELGEMNKKLLQKIEELTLHLIEQKKRVDLLVRENEQQKEDIEKLKSK